ncbi:MAG TPA: AAA family ATPase, partial [Bacillota bacterium]|nr:AAA family ATPase [Bacillota bacterium]
MKDIIFEKINIKAFGCLKDTVITPTAGINLINAHNGAGKSTLAAFIKFVFYGFSGTRLQGILGNEKNMYIPWDSNFVEGSIEFSCPKGRFCVGRYFCKPSKETVTVTELTGGKKVLDGIVPGEYFFGVSEETYTKTAFFYSLKRTKNGDPILAQQLENLVFSADEMMSYSNASDKINAARTEIVNRQNRGRLPSAEAALTSIENDLYTATQSNDELLRLTLSLNAKKELIQKRRNQQDELGNEQKNIEKYEAQKKLNEYRILKAEVEQALSDLEKAKILFGGDIPGSLFIEKLSSDNEKLIHSREKLEEERAAEAELQTELDRLRERNTLASRDAVYSKTEPLLASKAKTRSVCMTVFIFFALAFGALAGAFYGLKLDIPQIINYIVAGLCILSLAVYIISAIRLSSFASKYGYKSVRRFRRELKDYPEYEINMREKQSYVDRLNETIQTHEDECTDLSDSIGERIASLSREQPDESEYTRCITALFSDVSAGALVKSEYDKKHDIYNYNYADVDIAKLESDAEGANIPSRGIDSVRRDMDILNGMIEDLGKQCTDI